jgi:uncharacterized protein involved in outer membrane biogenesis
LAPNPGPTQLRKRAIGAGLHYFAMQRFSPLTGDQAAVQTTLLGIAIAIILALVAALVAPLVVDWNHYRAAFETEVGRLTGLNVHVGAIDARILPSPIIKLRDVVIGEPGRVPQLRADALELEVRLAPLVRGRVEATEARLVAPQIILTLDRSGALQLPGAARSFRPEELSVSRLSVEDGSIIFADAVSGAHAVLRKLSFTGDVRSLVGPFKGEGAFAIDGEPFAYRISGAQADDGSGFRVRLGADPQDQPLTTTVEGTLTFDGGAPQFAGTFALARLVGVTLSNGQRVMSDPWRANGTIKATPTSAKLDDLALQYGPDERAINFSGNADVTFGDHPHFSGSVKALEVDADRALAAPDMTRRPPLLVVRSFVDAFVQAARPPMPGDVALTIDGVTVGGTTIQSLHSKMRFDGDGWGIDALDFRAPGLTSVNLSGTLNQTQQGFAFAGPASLQSADAETLMAWLGGRNGPPPVQTGTLNAHGDLTISSDKLVVDRLTVKLDRESLDGRLAYAWPNDNQPAVVEADLHATRLNLDALSAFALSAADAGGFTLPRAGSLNLDIGNATFAGVDAQVVKTQIKFDAGALQIEQFSVGALAGAALDIKGRIDELSSQPRGHINADLDARTLDGFATLIDKFAPQAASVLRRGADRLAPAKIHAVITVDKASAGSDVRLDLNGQVGLMRLALNADAQGERSQPGAAHLHVESRLDADDGTALAALFGVDRVLGVDQLPGRATLTVDGPINGDLRVDGTLAASGLDTAARGILNVGGDAKPTGTLQMLATIADLRPLQQAMTGQPGDAVPVSARAAAAISGSDLSFTQIAASVGKSSVRGRVNVSLASPVTIDGDVSADNADGARVAALLLGLPRQAPGSPAYWSGAAVGAGAFAGINGAVTFKFDHAAFTPSLNAGDLKGVAQFRASEITLDNLDGNLAGGRLSGRLSFRRNADGLVSHGHVELADADAATLLQADNKTVAGHLTLKFDGDSIGATPAAAVSSLHGNGTVALNDASLGGLDTGAFVAAMRTADQANAIDPAKIQATVKAALGNGHFVVSEGDAPMTITGGTVSVANVTLRGQDNSALGVAGTFDLNTGTIDARLNLSADPPPHALIGKRPDLTMLLKGPLVAPAQSIDVSALTGWLALRASEFQTRRLESIEDNRRKDVIGRASRPGFIDVRPAPRGTLTESGILVGVPAAATGAQKPDLLQLEVPPPLPVPAPPRTAGPDKRAPLDLLRPQN